MLRPSSLIVVGLLCIAVSFCRGENTHVQIAPMPEWVVTRPAVEYEAPAPEKDRSGAYHLLIDRQAQAEKQEVYSHCAYRITSSAGLQRASQFSLSFDPDFEWIDLHELNVWRAGKIENRLVLEKMQIMQQERALDRYQYNGQLTALFILEDVRVGDVIEYAFTRRGRNPIFGRHLGEFEISNRTAPIRRQTIRLIADANHPIAFRQLGGAPLAHVTREEGTLIIHEWSATNQPGAEFEGGAPSWYFPFSVLQVSDFANWHDVVSWALPLYARKPISEPLREKVKEIVSSLHTDRDRTIAVLDFVQRDIRYLGVELGSHSHAPSEPDKVFKLRYGDCKDKVQLFCAMLNEIGISAVPALVQSSMGKVTREWLPSIEAFDHVIAKVNVAGLTYWVDPTLTDQAGTIEHRALPDYGWALPIEPQTTQLEAIHPPVVPSITAQPAFSNALAASNVFQVDARIGKRPPPTFADSTAPALAEEIVVGSLVHTKEIFTAGKPGEPAELEVVSTYGGLTADQMRAYLRETTSDIIGKNALNFRAKTQPGIKLLSAPTWEDDRRLNQISVTYHYHVPDFWRKAESSSVISAEFYPSSFREYLAAPETSVRTSPYAVLYPIHLIFETTIRLDRYWPVKDETHTITDAAFVGHARVTGLGKTVSMRYEYTALLDSVAASRMGEYTTHLRKLRDLLGYSLTFNPEIEKRNASYRLNWMLLGTLAVASGISTALAYWIYRRPWGLHSRRLVDPSPELTGLGGWLILVGFGVFMRPAQVAFFVVRDLSRFMDARLWENLDRHMRELICGEAAGQSALLIAMIFCAFTFVRRRRIFPLIFVACVALSLVFHATDWIACSYMPSWTDKQSLKPAKTLFQLVGAACIWVPYMFVSQRVKSTFTRERTEASKPVEPPPLPLPIKDAASVPST